MAFTSLTAAFGYNKVIEHFHVTIRAPHRNAHGPKILGLATETIDVDPWRSYICNCAWAARTLARCLINWKNVRTARLVNDAGIFRLNITSLDLDFSRWFWRCYWCRFWYVWAWGDYGLRTFIDICCACLRGWSCLLRGGRCCFWRHCFPEC